LDCKPQSQLANCSAIRSGQKQRNRTVEIWIANDKIELAVPAIEKPFGRSNLALIEQESLHALFD
jgi:hypothetical protein